jgi:hypothetical protein
MIKESRAGLALVSNKVRPVEAVSFYEHIATVYHQSTNQFFVAYQAVEVPLVFRELWDKAEALRDQRGREFKERLPHNQTRTVYIDKMTRRRGGAQVVDRISDWLEVIEDDAEFSSIVRFLIQRRVFDREMLIIESSRPGIIRS